MKSLVLFVVVGLLGTSMAARAEVSRYLGLGEIMIPVDGAAETPSVEPGQFFESFSGTFYYFRVTEGYESELISMGTPTPTTTSTTPAVSASTGISMSGDAVAPGAGPEPAPAVLGPYEIVGIYSYDTETGIDVGMDCVNPTIRIIGDPGERLFRLDCPDLMEM